MGLIENIGTLRNKLEQGKFEIVEAYLPIMDRILSEVLRRQSKIMKEGSYTELTFNSADLTETADELNKFLTKIKNKVKATNLKKLNKTINETVTIWNKYTDFLNQAYLIMYKLNLLGYLMQVIEDNSVEDNISYTLVSTLQQLARE